MKQIHKGVIMADKIVLTSNNSELTQKVQAFAQSLGVSFESQPESNVIQFGTPKAVSDQSVQSMSDVEKQTILQAIDSCRGNLSKVAKNLKIGRATLYRKLKEYSIEAKAFKKTA